MTDESAAFVLGFSFIQLAFSRATEATISRTEAVARDLHCLQARRMLTCLQLRIDPAEVPAAGLTQARQQAEMIFRLLRPRSTMAAWSFRLGCDLGALGTTQCQGVRSEQIETFTNKFDEECRESGVPFDLIRDVLWAAADTSLQRCDFIGRVSRTMNTISEHLDKRGLLMKISVQ